LHSTSFSSSCLSPFFPEGRGWKTNERTGEEETRTGLKGEKKEIKKETHLLVRTGALTQEIPKDSDSDGLKSEPKMAFYL
jgi:hypothetical protein